MTFSHQSGSPSHTSTAADWYLPGCYQSHEVGERNRTRIGGTGTIWGQVGVGWDYG